MTAPRDWDKEMAEIDKVIAKAPAPVPAKAGGGGQAPAPRQQASGPAPAPPSSGKAAFGTWIKVLLGAVLAGAMTQWPYANACGIGLFIYLGAAGVVVIAGVWGALSSWNRRMGFAHVVSLLVALWGIGLVTAVALPRMGYVNVRPPVTWFCP
jgi:hypothetical protein